MRELCELKIFKTWLTQNWNLGAAGESCAEVLRQEGFTGRIVVLAEEKFLPYDRVKCNKNMNFQVEDILLRTQDFYNVGGRLRIIPVVLTHKTINRLMLFIVERY